MITHICEGITLEGGDLEIYNHGDEDPEEYGWYISYPGYEYGRMINYCPMCGMDLMKVEWADLK